MFSCEEDNEAKEVPNRLIGTWRSEVEADSPYWFQFTFNEDLSGKRIDADKEDDSFTYTYTEDRIDFVGFPDGDYQYKLIGDSQLILFGNTLTRQ